MISFTKVKSGSPRHERGSGESWSLFLFPFASKHFRSLWAVDQVSGALLRKLLRLSGIDRLRALDLQDLRFDDELAEALLCEGGKLQRVRAYDAANGTT
jgi:hypothetical protein